MSKYRDAVHAKAADSPVNPLFSARDRENYPEIIALLEGEKNEKGQWDPSPCSLSLFIRENRLTACLKPKHDHLIAFTTLGEIEGLLEALEAIFCKLELDWRVPPKRK